MTITDLLTNTCTIIRRTQSGTADRFGNDLATEAATAGISCELQQASRAESGDSGEVSDDRWTLFLPSGTDFATGDSVVVDGHEYEAMGDPWPARHPIDQTEHHIECTVRRTRGAEDAS